MTTTKKSYKFADRWYVYSKDTNTAQRGPYNTEEEAIQYVNDKTYVATRNINFMQIYPRRLDNETDGI